MKTALTSLFLLFLSTFTTSAQEPTDLSVKLNDQQALQIIRDKNIVLASTPFTTLDTKSFETPAWLIRTSVLDYSVSFFINGNTGELVQVNAVKHLRCGTFSSDEERLLTLQWLNEEGKRFSMFIQEQWQQHTTIDFSSYTNS